MRTRRIHNAPPDVWKPQLTKLGICTLPIGRLICQLAVLFVYSSGELKSGAPPLPLWPANRSAWHSFCHMGKVLSRYHLHVTCANVITDVSHVVNLIVQVTPCTASPCDHNTPRDMTMPYPCYIRSLCLNLRRWLFNFWQTTVWIQDLLHISGFLFNICTQRSFIYFSASSSRFSIT